MDGTATGDDPLELAGLLCSRMAHDLVGPSGALANGMELLREETDPDGIREIVAMLEKSAATLNARLQFYRLAFGMAAGLGEEIDAGFLAGSLSHLLEQMRIRLVWEVARPLLGKREAKIVLNLALAVAECLIRGGTLAISEDGGTLAITGEGERLIVPDEMVTLLGAPDAPVAASPRCAPVLLALRAAAGDGRRLGLAEYRPSDSIPPEEGGRARLTVEVRGAAAG